MQILRLLSAGLLGLLLAGRPAPAQTLDPSFAPPASLYAPGQVSCLGPQQADGKRLVGGNFSRVNGTAVGNLIRLDANGALDLPFQQNVGRVDYVFRIKAGLNGQYLLGTSGGSITVGNTTRNEVLRLNANGTADASFDAGTGPTATVNGGYGYGMDYAVQPDGKVLVAGLFDAYDGQPAAGLVRLTATGARDASFSVGAGIDVNTNYQSAYTLVVQPDGKIVVGGYFNTFDGAPAPGLVRLNPNGSRDTSFAPALTASAEIEGVTLQPDGKLLVSGYALDANNSVPLVRLNANGSQDTGFSSSLSGSVTTFLGGAPIVLQPDGRILVAGEFTSTTGVFYGAARLNANGTPDPSFFIAPADAPDTVPSALGLDVSGNVLLGVNFGVLKSRETPLARLSSTGALDPAFRPALQLPGVVAAAVRQPNGRMVLAGNFTEYNGQAVHRIVRVETNGALETAFSAATGVLPGALSCLTLQTDGKLVVSAPQSILRLSANGTPDPSFAPTSFGAQALALQANGYVLAGAFGSSPNGTSYPGVTRLAPDGSIDPSFRVGSNSPAGTPSSATALAVQPDGKVVFGGRFNNGSSIATRVVRCDATGAYDPSFTPLAFTNANGTSSFLNHIGSLVLQADGKILAGGAFGAVGGTARFGVARLSTSGALDATFAPNNPLTGSVQALALQPNGRVLLGGSFNLSAPGRSLNNLARLLANGQTDASFANTATPAGGAVRSLLVQPDGAIVLAGAFTNVNSAVAVGVARITAPNVLAVAAPAAVAARTTAWPVPAHAVLRVAPDFGAQPRTVELLDALGRAVRQQPAAPETVLDLAGLAPGLYVLRVHYAGGDMTRRVVVE